MDKNEFAYVTYIRTTPEKLWAAITTPEFTRRYWSGGENISTWKKGAQWQHVAGEGEARSARMIGDVVESTPPKRLVLTWASPADATDVSRVTFEIETVDDLVRLSIIHGDFKAGSTMPGKISQGWPRVLSSLKTYMETGEPLVSVWSGNSCSTSHTKEAASAH